MNIINLTYFIITTLPFPTKKAVLLPRKSEPIQLFFMSTYHVWCSIFTVSVPWVKKIRDFIVSLCTLRLYFLYQFQKCSSNISWFSSFCVWASQMLLIGVEVFIRKSKIRKVLNVCWFRKNHWGLFCGRQGITFLNCKFYNPKIWSKLSPLSSHWGDTRILERRGSK